MSRTRTIGPRHLAAVILVSVGMTACGGQQGGGGDAPTARTTVGRASAQKARVLTQQQLEDAVVDTHDLPGVETEEIGEGTSGVGNGVIHAARRTATSPSLCAPVSAAVDGASGYTPVGSVVRTAESKGHVAILTLVSYRSADAARVVDDLREALKSCKRYTAGPMKATYEDIETAEAPPRGDDSIAFRLTLVTEPGEKGLKVPVSVLVLRQGSTLALYKATSDSPGTPASIPSDLVNAQTKVLDAAVHANP